MGEEFWRFDIINEADLIKECDTGDLLLLKTEDTGSLLQRAFSSSNFDHVAMIIRFESNHSQFFLVDCTKASGVACCSWDSLRKTIGPKKKYSQCVYRKVNFERSDVVSESIEAFLKEVDGC